MSAPQRVRWAVDCLVDELGVERAESELQDLVTEDNDRAKAGLSYLRREYDRGVPA